MNSNQENETEGFDGLRHKVDGIKKEVDALQVHVMRERKPWYKQIPIIVSVLALLFSFGTTGVSLYRTWQKDLFDYHSELRSLIQRLGALPRERIELLTQFENRKVVAARLTKHLSNEHTILAEQAAELVDRIPDLVSSSESLAVAVAFLGAQQPEDAVRFYLLAGRRAKTPGESVNAYAPLGGWIIVSDPKRGREYFSQGKQHLEKRFSSYHPYALTVAKLRLSRAWADAEARIGDCDQARALLEDANKQRAKLPSSPASNAWLASLEKSEKYVGQCKENVMNFEVPPN